MILPLETQLAQKTGSPVSIGLQNVRSLNNKVEDVVELIQDYKMDLMAMAETWHDPESVSISKLRAGVLWSSRKQGQDFPS